MKYGSLFAGIGGFDLGLDQAGMSCTWQVEINPFAAKVLERHWPEVKRYGDITTVDPGELEPVDLVCGGFPCQDLSVAGRRAGLAGVRSGLFWEAIRIVAGLHPRWVIIENVPGLLSSNDGRDMGTVLGALGELGYGWAYRVLDAQYFGVAQRRKRVFIVGHLGGRGAAEVLFEPEGSSGDTPPRREKGQTSATLLASGAGTNRPAGIGSVTDFLVPTVCGTLTGGSGKRGWKVNAENAADGQLVVALDVRNLCDAGEVSGTLQAKTNGGYSLNYQNPVMVKQAVRRLTPVEAERLQGFPDNWTRLDNNTPDSPRYRVVGNAVAVPVAAWIAKRIVSHSQTTTPATHPGAIAAASPIG